MIVKNKLNFIDLLIFITIALSITGYLFAKAEKLPLNKVIEGKEEIVIEVLLPDVYSSNNDYFKIGKKAHITIRNRPYTSLKIINFESKPKLAVIQDRLGSFKTIPDPTKANIKDYHVTLSDVALKTKDGYVIGGNKIKAGNPIELEGFNYRLNGKVINIHPREKEIN